MNGSHKEHGGAQVTLPRTGAANAYIEKAGNISIAERSGRTSRSKINTHKANFLLPQVHTTIPSGKYGIPSALPESSH